MECGALFEHHQHENQSVEMPGRGKIVQRFLNELFLQAC